MLFTKGLTMSQSTRASVPPLDRDYWDDPPRKVQGESTAEIFFPEVGRLLFEYEKIEFSMYFLFSQFVFRYPFFDALMHKRRYGSHTKVNARCDEILDILECYKRDVELPESIYKDIKQLINHVPKAASIRAKIAHGIVTEISLDVRHAGFFLTPTWYNAKQHYNFDLDWFLDSRRKPKDDPFYALAIKHRYVVADLNHFQSRFQEISQQLDNVGREVLSFEIDRVIK